MTFYDYDWFPSSDSYALRANMGGLPVGYCTVRPKENGGWTRKTKWRGNGSIRYEWFEKLDEALTSGVKWARRRERAEKRKEA